MGIKPEFKCISEHNSEHHRADSDDALKVVNGQTTYINLKTHLCSGFGNRSGVKLKMFIVNSKRGCKDDPTLNMLHANVMT